MSKSYTYHCGKAGCDTRLTVEAPSHPEASHAMRRRGWAFIVTSDDALWYCPAHSGRRVKEEAAGVSGIEE